MLENLHKANVPVLIFSAGVGNIVKEVLVHKNTFYPNKRIVSNFMVFDETGKISGFAEPMIHTFNKQEIGALEVEYFVSVKERTNVILLGDCIGDANMDRGVQNPDAVLKIGFLNDKVR